MVLFNEKQIEKINHILQLDRSLTLIKMIKSIKTKKNIQKTQKISNDRRPSWSNHTIINQSDKIPCTFIYNEIENNKKCRCSECLEDELKAASMFLIFQAKFETIDTLDDLEELMNEYNEFISKMLDLQLTVLRSDISINRWKGAFNSIMACNKFKQLVK